MSTNSALHPPLNKGAEGTGKPTGEMGSSAQIGVRRAIGGLKLGGQASGFKRKPTEMSFSREQIDEAQEEDASPGPRKDLLIKEDYRARESEEEQPDVLKVAEEMKIPDNDDLLSEMSAKIPVLRQKAAPKVLEAQALADMRQTMSKLQESFKQIDKSLNLQIFNGPSEEPRSDLPIRRIKQLGSGAQGDVFQVKIRGVPGKFVDKVRKIYNNAQLADQTMRDMYDEFHIAKALVHPAIIQYKYFMRKYDPDTKNYEFHIILELMQGEDME